MFTTTLYKLKDNFTEEDLNSWCIVTHCISQYAHGITGVKHTTNIYIQPDGKGYPYAAAAYKAAKDAGIKPASRKGVPSPYGNIGAMQFTRRAITLRELIATHNDTVRFQPMPEPKQ